MDEIQLFRNPWFPMIALYIPTNVLVSTMGAGLSSDPLLTVSNFQSRKFGNPTTKPKQFLFT